MAKILAIDDKMDNLVSLSALLTNLLPGCIVIKAQSGREGIARAKAESPDVILLDIIMPDMDGFETCQRLKDGESTKHIPIIMITAIKSDPRSRIRGLEIGADAFLAKPIDEYELVSQVNVALRIKKAEDSLRSERDSLEKEVQERTARLINEVVIRKKAEDAMRHAANEWSASFDAMSDGVSIHDTDYTILKVNRALCKMLGKSEDELIGKKCFVIFHGADHPMANCPIELTRQTGKYEYVELYEPALNAWLSVSCSPVRNDSGQLIRFVHVVRDISGRKKLEEVQAFLAQTNAGLDTELFFEKLASFLALILDMDFVCIDRLEGDGLNARTLAVWHNGRFEDNVSYALKDTPCGDVVGKRVCCFPSNVRQLFLRDQVLQDLLAESYIGVTLWSHTGEPIGLIAVIGRKPLINRQFAETILEMVTIRAAGELERLKDEEKLRESRAILQAALSSMTDAVFISDVNGRFIDFNDAFVSFHRFGSRAECADKLSEYPNFLDVFMENGELAPLNMWAVPRALRGEMATNAEYTLRRKDTGEIWIGSYSFAPIRNKESVIVGSVVVGRDITERKRYAVEKLKLEEQLNQAHRMESVGRLAGGVAHDFNNMLGVILGHADEALDKIDKGNPLFFHLQEIHKASERSSNLTRQLLAFARKQTASPKVLEPNEIIAGMLNMLNRLIGEDIQLHWLPGNDLWSIMIDPSQIDQILANLFVNARDAIIGTGKITIETSNISLDENYCVDHAESIPGEYVLLTVSDSGCGMDKEILGNIFEPFFTTKGMGKGTGLGLAMVYGIIKQNHGFITVYSEPGHGTTFKIYLPRHIGEIQQVVPAEQQVPVICSSGKETVLVVEDEPSLLDLCKIILEGQGYRVLAANTPEEAISLAQEHSGEIDLLMTDVVMPEMNGRDLANKMLSLQPNLKRLFMSGYTANVIADHGILDEGLHFIQKPFSRKDLTAKVREALDQK